jgi:hypothetical protein
MKVDVTFSVGKAYDISKIEVEQGEDFSLNTDATEPIKLFSDNDPALDIVQGGNGVEIHAGKIGKSTVLIMNNGFQTLKTVEIEVVEKVEAAATTLNLSADQPK